MQRVDETDLGERLSIAALRSALEEHPVRLAICFGSQVSGDRHERSDVDLAIEFDGIRPGDPQYNDVFFECYAAVSEALGTDAIDLVDVHSLSGSLARAVFERGVLLLGDQERVEVLRETLTPPQDRSPRERLDETIERIDEHLA